MIRCFRKYSRTVVRCAAIVAVFGICAGLFVAAATKAVRDAAERAAGGNAAVAGAVADTTGRTVARFLTLTSNFGAADLAAAARLRSTAEMLRVQAAFDSASVVFLADAKGHVVAASTPLSREAADVAATDWFRAGLRGTRDTVTATRVEASSLRPGPGMVLTRLMTRSDGAPLGLIGAVLPLSPDAGRSAQDWAVPGWAAAGTTVALTTTDGSPVVDASAAGEAPVGTRQSWYERAFLRLGGWLDPAPAIIATARVPHADLQVVVRLPRAVALANAWPASREKLLALAGAELLLLAAVLVLLLTAKRRPRPGQADGVPFGSDWVFSIDRRGRLAKVGGAAPAALRDALGEPVATLGDATLTAAIAGPSPGDEAPGRAADFVLSLPGADAAPSFYRVRLCRQVDGGWQGDGRDITAEHVATSRAEVAERKAENEHHKRREIELERDRVLSAVGHDVRTPMNSILGICALLLEGDLEDDQRAWITRMRASCEALLAMLNGLLEIASLDSGAATLQPCEVDVADLVREVTETLAPQASDKGLNLSVSQDDALGGWWMTDPTRLRQILFNLLGNAIKYTASGKVALRTSVLSGADGKTSLRIAVVDSGPGIAPEERARIFDRFKRGEGERALGGLGLGLALCRDIAALMNGSLMVEGRLGVGSEFTFTFPAERVPDRARARPGAGCSCVVVGFAGALLRELPERLAALGFTVESAPDGFVGFGLIERVATQRGSLDLVVLDGALTGMKAANLAYRLRVAAFSRAITLLGVIPEQGNDVGFADAVDATVAATAGAAAIAKAAATLVAGRSPLATLGAGMAEAPSRRVLVAEDNKINQALLSAALGRRGFTIFVADNGEDAVRVVAQGGFDAVLMDIQMPGIDGLEATRRIRGLDTPARTIPIIALTAISGSLIQARCKAAGATAIVEKPVDVDRLAHMLRDWIARGGPAAASADDAPASDGADLEQPKSMPGPDGPSGIAAASASHAADACPFDDEDDEADVIEVSDAFLECLVADVGLTRARSMVETFGREATARNRQLQELLPAWEAASIVNICHDLEGVAVTLGAVALSECLESLADATKRGARDEADRYALRLDEILEPTLSILAARLAGMDDRPSERNPRAA